MHESEADCYERGELLPGREHFVVDLDGAVVGYGNLTNEPVTANENYGITSPGLHCILHIVVHPDHQSQGVGSKLIRHIEQCARTLGASGIFVSVDGHGDVQRRVNFFNNQGMGARGNALLPPEDQTPDYCVKIF